MFKDFFDGLGSYGKAFRAISKMGLWGYALVPALFTIVLMIIIGFTAWGLSDNVGNLITGWWPWEWGADVVAGIGTWTGGLIIAVLGILSLKYLVMIVVAPFMSLLSEKVEAKLTGATSTATFSFSTAIKDIIRGIRISLRNIIRELFYTLLLLILGLIPGVNVIVPFLIFFVQSFYAGAGNADYTLERHFTVRQSVYFSRRHRGLMVGNGAVFMLLLMTGIGFLIAPPLSTVAATMESVKRLDAAGYIDSVQNELV